MNAIFGTSLIEGVTTRERAIYMNEARRYIYLVILKSPPSSPGRPIYFSETDAYVMHFSQTTLVSSRVQLFSILMILYI